jgi:hypothetical protein
MIQRIQSLWLFLSAASAAIFCYLPIYNGTILGNPPRDYFVQENLILFALSILVAVISFVNIFFFKNRVQQKILIVANVLFTIAVFVLQYFLVETLIKETQIIIGNWQIAAILPLFIVVFHCFAYVGIRKDEKLLSSADRMR